MTRRLGPTIAAAAVLAGIAVVFVPQHAASVAQLAVATVVVLAAVYLLVVAGALSSAEVPRTGLDAVVTSAPTLDPQGLRDARRDLAAACGAGSLPRAVWERLAVAAVLAFGRRGIDIDSPNTRHEGQRLVTPTTWRLLTTPPPARSVTGPTAGAVTVARTVHRVLDELEAITSPGGPPP